MICLDTTRGFWWAVDELGSFFLPPTQLKLCGTEGTCHLLCFGKQKKKRGLPGYILKLLCFHAKNSIDWIVLGWNNPYLAWRKLVMAGNEQMVRWDGHSWAGNRIQCWGGSVAAAAGLSHPGSPQELFPALPIPNTSRLPPQQRRPADIFPGLLGSQRQPSRHRCVLPS